jgi:hypothetical protein
MHQLHLICELLGYPEDLKMSGKKEVIAELEKMQHCRSRNLHKLLPDATNCALELIYKMLHWDPKV